ncbi:MAG: hypothetical protein EOM68_29140, partial [Spirochaetia bacterium]|nr:hypothetical protein [Spirochaetia bacterium]
APAGHPYLVRKDVRPNGIRMAKDGRLVLPLYDADGMMSTVQYINDEGKKLYLPGGATGGCGWMLGDLSNASKVYLAEGFATAASIFEETGRPVGIAYSAGNLPAMAQILRSYSPDANIIIVADNDFPNKNTGVTIGLVKATEASKLVGCNVVMPPEVGHDANDFRLAGGSLKELLGEARKRMICADDLTSMPSPISWLVKGWVQNKAMIMVHGPSGSGKSFVVLDWMCTIASGKGQWLGKRTKTGDVIYLCGEGHHGLRARAKAWKIDHNVGLIGNLLVSTGASDLDKLGDLNQVVQDIVDTGVKPKLIVIDTLNRFMSGDENSAKDTRAFLDACSQLMLSFDCSVLIIHHTGLNQEAQGRARGSSAWKGAMDIEISVKPTSDGLVLSMTKSKDTEAA